MGLFVLIFLNMVFDATQKAISLFQYRDIVRFHQPQGAECFENDLDFTLL